MGIENLPEWAKEEASDSEKLAVVVQVNSAAAYKEWLELLQIREHEVDQYWLEVAYQCAKLDVHEALAGGTFDPRLNKKPVEIRFSNAPQYALANFESGRGIAMATQGKEARTHFMRVRGRMPF